MLDSKIGRSWGERAVYTSVYFGNASPQAYSYKKTYSRISAEGVTAIKNWSDTEKSQVLVYKYIMMSLFQTAYSHIQGFLPSTTVLTVVSPVCYRLRNLRADWSECKALCGFYNWNSWQKSYLSEATEGKHMTCFCCTLTPAKSSTLISH